MLFKEINALYPEKHSIPMNTVCGQNAELMKAAWCLVRHQEINLFFFTFQAGGTYIRALKGLG
jgi:hypothetical protein